MTDPNINRIVEIREVGIAEHRKERREVQRKRETLSATRSSQTGEFQRIRGKGENLFILGCYILGWGTVH